LMAGPGKYVDETLKYLNNVYEMVVIMLLICHEYKVTAVPKLVIAMNKLMTILGVPGGEKIEEDFKFGLAFADNKLDKDLGGALDEIAKRLAAVIGAGQYPVDGKEPLMAMAETLMETFGDISPGLSFDETMRGHVGPSRNWTGPASNAYDVAAKGGESFTANFSVNVIHAYHLMNDKPEAGQHDGSLSGEVAWEHADGTTETLSLTDGTFDLLKQDEAEVECWTMTYTGVLDGRFNFKGVKTLRRRKGSTYFGDVTTLYVDLEPIDPNKDQGHQGVLSLGLPDLATQLSTLQGRFKNARPLEAVLKDMRTAISDNNAKTAFLEGGLFKDLIEALLAAFNDENLHPEAAKALDEVAKLFTASLAAVFGKLIFRTYGGMTAYAYNFPAREDVGKTIPKEEGDALPAFPKIGNQHYPVKTGDGQTVKLYRFKGGTKGPVMMASGFGTTALSYGLLTNETSLLQELLAANYDVWLFDYRSSPFTEKASTTPFTLDDIAKYDWPAAIDIVLQARKDDGEPVKDVQVLGHCVGSMSLQMAMLAGYVTDVRQMVSSQLTVHPVTNWFNQLKSDTFTAKILAQGLPKPLPALVGSVTGSSGLAELLGGLDTIDMNSDPDDTEGLDPILNALAWKVPFPYAEACYSPTCHRIFGIYGPAYMHANLNEATHNAIKTVFGKVSSKPFEHLTLCMRNGIAVNADGQDVYLPHYKRLDMPIHFIAGAKNLEFLPDTSLRTMTWLHEKMPERADLFTRKVYPDYAHMDIFIGKANPNPIFADIVAKFDEMN
ncbi:MAG: hypothetical protein OXQ30_13245, partial [Boseongicola sp.]|nr:hypothetical protein [Boseongicola sp.]